MDLQTSREKLAIVDKVGSNLRHTAWAAANPQLAAEVELWKEEPRRASKLNNETVVEAVSYAIDVPMLEKLQDTDRRTSVRDTISDKLRKLRNNQPQHNGYNQRYANQREHLSLEAFLKEAGGVELEEVAPLIERWAWRYNPQFIQDWLDGMTAEQLDKMLTHRLAYGSEPLIVELMRRGRIDEAFTKAHDSTLISVLARHFDITEDLYDRLRARKLAGAGARFRFAPDGVAALKRHRAFSVMLHNHIITIEELANEFGDFSLDDLHEIFNVRMSDHELKVLEEPVLRYIASTGEAAPSFMVGVYNRKPVHNPTLAKLITLSDGPREVLTYLFGLQGTEMKEVLDEFQRLRGDDVSMLLNNLGMMDDSPKSREVLELLLTRAPLQIRNLSQIGGWVITEILDRMTAELEEGDWPLFFKLFDSFTGTVDELLMTISAVRS
jgi:hypothetical protein